MTHIGQGGTWEPVGTGYPTAWRYTAYDGYRDSTNTQLNRARTLDGHLALADSFVFTTRLNLGGYDHHAQAWRERNDTLRVSGVYEEGGPYLLLEPETCDNARGPLLGFVKAGEVAIYYPKAAWEHWEVSLMRFAIDRTVQPQPKTLPEGAFTEVEVAYVSRPCTPVVLPVIVGGSPKYVSYSLKGVSARITATELALDIEYVEYNTNWPYGPGTSKIIARTITTRYERHGNIVVPFVNGTTDAAYTPPFFGYVQGDTLVLHGLRKGFSGPGSSVGFDPVHGFVLRIALR